MTPADIITEIIKKEGGFADHKSDKGGATNFGISLRYAKSKGLMFDLDKDGDVDAADIRVITREQAYQAYMEDFFLAPGFDKCPVELQSQLTDFAVNSGPGQAVKCLQKALIRLGATGIAADGQLGPKSYAVIGALSLRLGAKALSNALVEERLAFLAGIVQRDPSQKAFINGWTHRARSFLI